MKKILYICAISVVLPLCGFGSGSADEEVFRAPNEKYFVILDSSDSTYRYCLTEYEDSNCLMGREISVGLYDRTNVSLRIFSSDMKYTRILFMYYNNLPENVTRIIMERYLLDDSSSVEDHITLYNPEGKDSIVLTPSTLSHLEEDGKITDLTVDDSFYDALIPERIGAIRICKDGIKTPIIDLSEIPWHKRNTLVYEGVEFSKTWKKYNVMWVKFASHRPLYTSVFYWQGNDTLVERVRPPMGRAYKTYVALIRERRQVITRKNDDYHPYIIRTLDERKASLYE